MGEKKSRDEGKTKFIRIKPNRFDKMFFLIFFLFFSAFFRPQSHFEGTKRD